MPSYEFLCKECGARFDVTESVKQHDLHKDKCPKCGSKRLEQRLGTFYAKTAKKS